MFDQVIKAVDSLEASVKSSFENLNTKQRELADELLQLKQRGTTPPLDTLPPRVTLGESVARKFSEVAAQFHATKTARFTVPFEIKAVGAFTGSTSIIGSHGTLGGGMTAQSPADLMLLGSLPKRLTGGTLTAHYGRYTGMGGAAAVQASEGASKAEVTPLFTDITQNAVTVAGFTRITEQALKGDGEIAAVVDTFLQGEVLEAADAMLIGGTSATAWPFAGYLALATAYPSAAYTDLGDAIADCVQNSRQAGFMCDVVVVNAMSYLAIVLSKNTAGDYLIPAAVTSAPTDIRLHGCKVVFSSLLAVDEALVIDSRFCGLGVASDMTIEIGHDTDDFTRNRRTIRAEISLIPTLRHVGAVRLVTPLP